MGLGVGYKMGCVKMLQGDMKSAHCEIRLANDDEARLDQLRPLLVTRGCNGVMLEAVVANFINKSCVGTRPRIDEGETLRRALHSKARMGIDVVLTLSSSVWSVNVSTSLVETLCDVVQLLFPGHCEHGVKVAIAFGDLVEILLDEICVLDKALCEQVPQQFRAAVNPSMEIEVPVMPGNEWRTENGEKCAKCTDIAR